MLDYPSARFRDVRADRRRICGYVNGKNRLGAYAGWKRFVAVPIEGTEVYVEGEDPNDIIGLTCDHGEPLPQSPDYSDRLTAR